MHISRLQFRAEGPDFNAELIPVHSPLLRESCLVSYPPLTYMLKFSGFADLTSCQMNGLPKAGHKKPGSRCRTTQERHRRSMCCHLVGCDTPSRSITSIKGSYCRSRPILGAQTRAADTASSAGKHKLVSSMKPKQTLKQACFQGYPESAVYVQVPVGSRNSASRNAYHTSLRPSSLFEPRHPSLKVVGKHSPIGGHRQQAKKAQCATGNQ